ncbi:hypothetical protein LR48_Vigan05g228400 [Vigna angularis]|uniref:Uncharacterized protein n=2 Tax=Phaseolus angularis TaxID=3914 RepID=A0A0L9UQ69_PHAAN|nr:uncharacterized protein HKW66_Vig0211190 [Vigna angularis]KOM44679.1 hypothetical protein LR48_Vigan05g228400 [Vigna angularis]
MANSNSSKKDPFDFPFDLAHISESQEQILRDVSVVGAHSHRSPSPSSAAVDSPIPMEVFHTPSQNSPLPSFCASDPTPTTECHDPCTLNHTVNVDAVTLDLSKGVVEDSEMEKTGRSA